MGNRVFSPVFSFPVNLRTPGWRQNPTKIVLKACCGQDIYLGAPCAFPSQVEQMLSADSEPISLCIRIARISSFFRLSFFSVFYFVPFHTVTHGISPPLIPYFVLQALEPETPPPGSPLPFVSTASLQHFRHRPMDDTSFYGKRGWVQKFQKMLP